MIAHPERVLCLLSDHPGLTDREITDQLVGTGEQPQAVNQACRTLAAKGRLVRRHRSDGRFGNYIPGATEPTAVGDEIMEKEPLMGDALSEDKIKETIDHWLREGGWYTKIAWGKTHGIDIEATRENERWIIEVKGSGSSQPMRVNYFLGVLGEILQRMKNKSALYGIAVPDLPQFRGLWERPPKVVKTRLNLSAIFVSQAGLTCPRLS